MSLGIAIRAFFAALGNQEKAGQIDLILSGQRLAIGAKDESPPKQASTKQASTQQAPQKPTAKERPEDRRDSAVTLLATLQREARLVDLIQEDLGKYSDAQVGAAARPCLQQCAGVLERVMGLKPLLDASEGEPVEVSADASPTRFQWIGEGTSASGKLVHHGWQVSKLELPTWTGDVSDANVIAAAQVQAS